MNRAVVRFALAVAVVVSTALVVVPSASGAAMDLLTQKIIAQNDPVIVFGTALEWAQPDVYGNYAAWQVRLKDADGAGPGTAPGDWDVYVFDLRTGTKERASTTSTGQQRRPRLAGEWVVYEDNRAGTGYYDIYAYNFVTNTEKLVSAAADSQYSPDISGTKVVWYDWRNGSPDVYAKDLAGGGDVLVAGGAGTQYMPAISGTKVAYVDEGEVMIKDVASSAVTTVTDDAFIQRYPDIDGTTVVYESENSVGDYDIMRYFTLTGQKINLTSHFDGDCVAPSVSGTKVVFTSYAAGPANPDLYAFDQFIGDVPYRLTDSADREGNARISGANVVWTGDGTLSGYELGNIYAGRLVFPSISFTAPPTVVSYGSRITATGTMTENGIPFGGQPLGLAWSLDGVVWTNPGGANTAADGKFSIASAKLGKTTKFRLTYSGDYSVPPVGSAFITHFSAYSAVKTVGVRAYVGAPSTPSTVKHGVAFTSRGALKPQHTVGATAGYIYCYRKESGRWKLRKTVTAKGYSDYRYTASIKLPSAGSWRMRFYHPADAWNVATYSGWKYKSVQ